MNKFDYLIFDVCLAYCNLCRSSSIKNEIYLGECGHSYCITCYDKLFQTRHKLYSVFYGCSPCPNNCVNPRKGIQCNCDAYKEVIDAWSKNKPYEYNQWRARENMFQYKNKKRIRHCPLCIHYLDSSFDF